MHVAEPIDHVMYGVADLDAAAAVFERDLGLVVSEGGAHPDGTRNRTIDCADGSYVKLLVVDTPTSPEACWIRDQIRAGRRLLGWALLASDLDAVSVRLDLPVVGGSIQLPDGRTGSWQMVGVAEAMADPSLPFFIQYDRAPGTGPAARALADAPDRIAWVEVAGDAGRLRSWLGGIHPSVRVTDVGDADAGVQAVAITRGGEEMVLR